MKIKRELIFTNWTKKGYWIPNKSKTFSNELGDYVNCRMFANKADGTETYIHGLEWSINGNVYRQEYLRWSWAQKKINSICLRIRKNSKIG